MMKYTDLLLLFGLFFLNTICLFSQTNLNQSDKYVIVLDIQEGYTDPMKDDSAYLPFIESVNCAIENTNPENIIYVVAPHKALSISFKSIRVDTLVDLKLDGNLKIANSNIFIKNNVNAFKEKELLYFLNEKNVKEIVIIGLTAENCVSSTLLGGKNQGYTMYVIPEAIIGKNIKSRDKTLTKLYKKGITELSLYEYCNKN